MSSAAEHEPQLRRRRRTGQRRRWTAQPRQRHAQPQTHGEDSELNHAKQGRTVGERLHALNLRLLGRKRD